jgi:PAS domain S-box-containing protein
MKFLPAIPREPVRRLRLLSLWFVLFAVGIEIIELAVGRLAPTSTRIAGAVSTVALGAWLLAGYRRRRFPEFSTPFEAALLVIATAASSLPLRGMGLFLATVQFRSLYLSRREFWLLPLSFGVARVIGMSLTVQPAPYDALSITVLFQFFGMVFVSGILFLLLLSVERARVADAALTRSEERYRVLATASHDMVYEWNVATASVVYSDAIRTLFGYDREALLRDRYWWVGLVHPQDREGYESALRALLESRDDVRANIRYRIRRADGEERNVTETAVVQRDGSGHPVAVVSSVRDVTGEERLATQLQESQKMEAVGQLAGGVAHDFNNLLTVIGGHVFMLEQAGPLPPAAAAQLEGINRATERAGALTRQLLAFGRRQMLRPVDMDLNVVVRDATRLIGPVLGERVRLTTDLAEDLPLVHADPGQLEQVLLNLALNARDAMPNGGRLRIRTSLEKAATGDRVCLVVKDNGQGMDAKTMAHVFEPFFTTKRAGKGTGLGLATAYGIIKQSAGDIRVDSDGAGAGSTFTISLPVSAGRAAAPAPAPTPSRRTAIPMGVSRALLAEDNDGVRDFAREVLIRAGISVIAATDGADGLAKARADGFTFDIVVTDIVMPELTGPQMVERLREVRPELRVLYLTGYADDAVTSGSLIPGREMLIEKPFTARALRDAISTLARTPVAQPVGELAGPRGE